MKLYGIRTIEGDYSLWYVFPTSENPGDWAPVIRAEVLTESKERALDSLALITWIPTELVTFTLTEVNE